MCPPIVRFISVLLVTSAFCFARKPNVIVILSDDQGWGDLSIHGNTGLETPNIDSLARDGARFDRFYVCPVCSPTRAEFLTGRYHARGGVYSTSAGGERLDLDEITIADTFKAGGYRTGAFGKWHNGMQYPYHPNGRGFEEYYGFCSGHWGDYFNPDLLEHNGKLVRGEGFVVDDFTNKAMAFMEKHRDSPFFVYLPYNTPHSPMQVPDRWWKKFRDKELSLRGADPKRENLEHTKAALAMCENIDWNVGRILKKLDELNLAEDTIILYFCDNGPNGARWNGGMKGRKGSTDEGGVRSPLFIRWPSKIAPGKEIKDLGAAIDLLPTLATMAGIPVVSKNPLDGIDLSPVITQAQAELPSRLIFNSWRGRVSVRTPQYRLDHTGRLYDMLKDPGQKTDISKQETQTAARLKNAANNWEIEVLSYLPKEDKRRFPVGHPNFLYTQLPARDAIIHGNLKRSNRFPNDSYFTNWTSTTDRITWNVDVLTSAVYEATLYYTCPKEAIGTEIQLSAHSPYHTPAIYHLSGKTAAFHQLPSTILTTTISESHDPSIRGGEHDRVTRMESYVKDFKAHTMGRIRLNHGNNVRLTLQAPYIPEGRAIDFRLLMLTRVQE